MEISVSLLRKINSVEDPAIKEVLYDILEEMERQRSRWEMSVTKVEFNDLKDIVKEIAEAQKNFAYAQNKTEQSLSDLAQAQKRTEQRLNELAEAQKKTEQRLNELAEAQKRTEQRLNELAEAQKKTEQRLNQLAEAQNKTEQRLNELAEAQKRTEEEIRKLAKGLNEVRTRVGGLEKSVGFALENDAYRHLPKFLEKNHGIKVIDRLIRTYIGGKEINIFGKAKDRDGREVFLVGEASLKLDDARKLKQVWENIGLVKEEFGGDVIPILVTHFARPEVLEKANKAGVLVIQSFEWI